jgi:hypothetical protein
VISLGSYVHDQSLSIAMAANPSFPQAARSGSRMSNRYATKNSKLDSSKWFAEGTEVETMLGRRH